MIFLDRTLFWDPNKANSIFATIPSEWVGREVDYMFDNGIEHQQDIDLMLNPSFELTLEMLINTREE